MELDFSSIQFCGRRQEVKQLKHVLQEACIFQKENNDDDDIKNDGKKTTSFVGNPDSRWKKKRTTTTITPITTHVEDLKEEGQDTMDQNDEKETTVNVKSENKEDNHYADTKTPPANPSSASSPATPSPPPPPRVVSVFVQGPGGSGKTALVDHVLELIRTEVSPTPFNRIIVARGKFEKSTTTTPMETIIDCLYSLFTDLTKTNSHWFHSIQDDIIVNDILILSTLSPKLRQILSKTNNRHHDQLCTTTTTTTDVGNPTPPTTTADATTSITPTTIHNDDEMTETIEVVDHSQNKEEEKEEEVITPITKTTTNHIKNNTDDTRIVFDPTANREVEKEEEEEDNDTKSNRRRQKMKRLKQMISQRNVMNIVQNTNPLENNIQRISLAMKRLIRYLREEDEQYTVVFVIENLHWADETSIKLLQTIALDRQSQSNRLVFIMTLRNDISLSSPAEQFQTEIRHFHNNNNHNDTSDDTEVGEEEEEETTGAGEITSTAATTTLDIVMNNLNEKEVGDIISRLLRRDVSDVSDLTHAVLEKTSGTIYFVVQFLRLLYQRQFIYFSLVTYRWDYNLHQILGETNIADNVMQLVCDKIAALPQKLQLPLAMASFLGSARFEAPLLLELIHHCPILLVTTNQDEEEKKKDGKQEEPLPAKQSSSSSSSSPPESMEMSDLEQVLDMAVQEGLIRKLHLENDCYKFCHDRVRDGALALIPTGEQKTLLHLQVGRTLHRLCCQAEIDSSAMDNDNENDDDDDAKEDSEKSVEFLTFMAVRHLNAGLTLMEDPQERVELAKLNLRASQIVMRQSAYQEALDLQSIGLRLLNRKTRWKDHYDLTLQLSTSLSRCRFCLGNYQANWGTIDDVLKHAKCITDKVGVYMNKINSLSATGKPKEAIENCQEALGELGIDVPRQFLSLRIMQMFYQLRRKLRTRTEEDLVPKRTAQLDDVVFFQVDFLTTLFHGGRIHGKKNHTLFAVLQLACLLLDKGCEELAQITYASVGYVVGRMGDWKKMYRYAKLAVEAAEERRRIKHDLRITALAYHDILLWQDSYHDSLKPLLRAATDALEIGDVEATYFPLLVRSIAFFQCGFKLGHLKKDMLGYVEMLEDFGQPYPLMLYKPTVQLVLSLMNANETKEPARLVGSVLTETTLNDIQSDTSDRGIQYFYRNQMILAYYLGDLNLAAEMSSKLNSLKKEGRVSWVPARVFIQGLVEAAMYKSNGNLRHKRRAITFQRKLSKIANEGNVNCRHTSLLLDAVLLTLGRRVDEKTVQAAFDSAIAQTARKGFTHDQALGNELVGVYYLDQVEDLQWASTYLTRSYELFHSWGALAKTRQMERLYGKLIDKDQRNPYKKSSGHNSKSSVAGMRPRISKHLALATSYSGQQSFSGLG